MLTFLWVSSYRYLQNTYSLSSIFVKEFLCKPTLTVTPTLASLINKLPNKLSYKSTFRISRIVKTFAKKLPKFEKKYYVLQVIVWCFNVEKTQNVPIWWASLMTSVKVKLKKYLPKFLDLYASIYGNMTTLLKQSFQ